MPKAALKNKKQNSNSKKSLTKFVLYLLLGVSLIFIATAAINSISKQAKTTIFDAVNTSYEVPVMLVMFMPDTNSDGIVDESTGYSGYYDQFEKKSYKNTVGDLRLKLTDQAYKGAKLLTQATKYHGYKNPNSKPSITYNIRHNYIYESKDNPNLGQVDTITGKKFLDYNSILTNFEICRLVDEVGIKEVWLYAPENDQIKLIPSNMSSKLIGDISNSNRDPNDLPICNKTYTVYSFDISKGVEEMLIHRASQIQELLSEWPKADVLNDDVFSNSLYWGKYVGANLQGHIIRPGCGYVKRAPNSSVDYDYFDESKVDSTCEHFEGDIKTSYSAVSCKTWSRYYYGTDECKVDGGISYLMWWMQNIPGQNNYILYQGRKLRNWWDYVGDIERVYNLNNFYVLDFTEHLSTIPRFNGGISENPSEPTDSDDHLYTHPLIVKPSKSTIEFPLDVKWSKVDTTYNYWVKIDLRGDGEDYIYYEKLSPNTTEIRIDEDDLEDDDKLYNGSIIDITIYSKSAKYGDRKSGPSPYRLVSDKKAPINEPVSMVEDPKPVPTSTPPIPTVKDPITPTVVPFPSVPNQVIPSVTNNSPALDVSSDNTTLNSDSETNKSKSFTDSIVDFLFWIIDKFFKFLELLFFIWPKLLYEYILGLV